MHFLDEFRLSWFKFHAVTGGSTRLMFDEFLVNPGTFHRLSDGQRDLEKWSPQFPACEGFQWWWNGAGSGYYSVLLQSIIPWLSILDGLFHQFLQNAHQSISKSIALQMVWAAGGMVNLVEFKELLKFPGTVAQLILTPEYELLSKLCENHP